MGYSPCLFPLLIFCVDAIAMPPQIAKFNLEFPEAAYHNPSQQLPIIQDGRRVCLMQVVTKLNEEHRNVLVGIEVLRLKCEKMHRLAKESLLSFHATSEAPCSKFHRAAPIAGHVPLVEEFGTAEVVVEVESEA